MDKRAFTRIPMTLDTRLITGRGETVAGVVRDFCAGGVFVALESDAGGELLREGEPVFVRVTVQHEDFTIPAAVARRLENGVGLAFRDPDQSALSALQKMAIDSHKKVSGAPLHRRDGVVDILEACHGLVRDGLARLIRGFNAEIEEELVKAAAGATNNVTQSRFFDAVTAVKPLRPAIETALSDQVSAHLMDLGRFALQPSDVLEATWSGSLSLVDEDIFEDFLALSEIAVRANDRFQEPLKELDQRFSRLVATKIEERTNPVSPEAICEAFREAIRDIKAHRDALQVIYRFFDKRVVSGLGEIFDGLNRLLAERGITPLEDERPKVVRKSPVPPKQQPEPAPAEEEQRSESRPVEGGRADGDRAATPAQASSRGEAVEGSARSNTSGFNHRPAVEPYPPQSASAAAAPPGSDTGRRVGEAQAGGEPAGVSQAAMAERARVIDSAYHTAQRLLDMEQGLLEHTQELTLPRSLVTQGNAASSFSPREVAHGLADLQEQISPAEAGEMSLDEMETRLLREMTAQHPEKGKKKIGPGERNNLRLITNLLSALMSDNEVATAIKRRIQKLRLPVQRVGLADENFITDPNHSARRVLDNLAGLEADMEITGGVLGDRLDSLVDRILAERHDPAAAFSEVLPEVEELRREQENAYSEGISNVVKECRQRAEFMRARRRDDGKDTQPPQRIVGSPEEQKVWRQWIQRVDRLQEGDALLFDRDTPHPRRAQLVWMDDNRDEFVFVNGRGQKSDSLSARELAMGLRRGTTEVLAAHSLSPVERAMLDMLRGVQERLQREATHEPLTRLPNEREFMRLLEEALHRAVQEKADNVVGYLSLLPYKDTVKRLGSDAGAELLRVAGYLLTENRQPNLSFGDLGQGRFGLLLTETALKDVGDSLERLLHTTEDDALEWEGEAIPVRFVIGLAEMGPNSERADLALKEAITACHMAREAGSLLGLASEEERQAQRKRAMADWAGRLNETLSEDRLLLRAQKVMPLSKDGETRPFYELLLGLRDETGDAISPREFLEAAEYYNQLLTVDRWVIRNVIQWLSGSPPGLDKVDGFTINLSGASLADDALGDYVLELLLNSTVPPGRLCFEVSQSDALAHHSNAERFIRSVTDLGCRIALHNFGHGDSSYAYLKDLPLDYIKIGGAFVEGMARNPSDHAVVNSINEVAHMMGKRTVAEHVESEAALVRLRDMGVDFAQGYYVAKPRYLDELLERGLAD